MTGTPALAGSLPRFIADRPVPARRNSGLTRYDRNSLHSTATKSFLAESHLTNSSLAASNDAADDCTSRRHSWPPLHIAWSSAEQEFHRPVFSVATSSRATQSIQKAGSQFHPGARGGEACRARDPAAMFLPFHGVGAPLRQDALRADHSGQNDGVYLAWDPHIAGRKVDDLRIANYAKFSIERERKMLSRSGNN